MPDRSQTSPSLARAPRRRAGLLVLTALAALVAAVPGALASGESIGWYTFDGGGGVSTGGGWSVAGTIGQGDSGPALVGANGMAVRGGFWAGFATAGQQQNDTLFVDSFE